MRRDESRSLQIAFAGFFDELLVILARIYVRTNHSIVNTCGKSARLRIIALRGDYRVRHKLNSIIVTVLIFFDFSW